MGRIRPFTFEDVSQVALLHQRVFGAGGADLQSLRHRESYLKEIFLAQPLCERALTSQVYEDGGNIVGFLGVVPREMSFKGTSVLAAVSSQFIVDPGSRSRMAGVQLLKKFFEGPQDLSITDEANDRGRKLWEGLGGSTALLYSLTWIRLLRPSRYALSLLRQRKSWAWWAGVVSPVAGVIDAATGRIPLGSLRRPNTEAYGEAIGNEEIWANLPRLAGDRSLRTDCNLSVMKAMLARAEAKQGCGRFTRMAVQDSQKDFLGWYLYYLCPGETSEVLQIVAKPEAKQVVFGHLLHHAWQGGSVALSGRLQPSWVQVLSDNHCYFHGLGPWFLIHSRRAELLQTFHEGKAVFSRLEGEWCLRYR